MSSYEKSADDAEIRKITRSIESAIERLERQHHEHKPYWDHERRWKRWEVMGLWAAAIVGLLAIGFSSWDAHEQREVAIGQLNQMKTDSVIRRYELRADFKLDFDDRTGNMEWTYSPIFTNIGKTDANDVKAWDDLVFIEMGRTPEENDEILRSTDFSYKKKIPLPGNGTVTSPGEQFVMNTQVVTISNAWDEVYGVRWPIIYGHVEYKDMFGVSYEFNFCSLLEFKYHVDTNRIESGLPKSIALPCNARAKKNTKMDDEKE